MLLFLNILLQTSMTVGLFLGIVVLPRTVFPDGLFCLLAIKLLHIAVLGEAVLPRTVAGGEARIVGPVEITLAVGTCECLQKKAKPSNTKASTPKAKTDFIIKAG